MSLKPINNKFPIASFFWITRPHQQENEKAAAEQK